MTTDQKYSSLLRWQRRFRAVVADLRVEASADFEWRRVYEGIDAQGDEVGVAFAPSRIEVQRDDGVGPIVSARFELDEAQRPQCIEVRVVRRAGGENVVASGLLRQTALDRLGSDAFARVIAWGERRADVEGETGDFLEDFDTVLPTRPMQGRPDGAHFANSDDEVQLAATLYMRAEAIGESPTKYVTEHLSGLDQNGNPNVSRATASRRIAEARERGLLPKRGRGRPTARKATN
jgi:hypothetical protein